MFRKISDFIIKSYNSILFLTGMLILLLSVGLYFLVNKSATDVLIEQMLHREQLASRIGAKMVEVFMHDLSSQVSAYATGPYLVSPDKIHTPKDLEVFLDRWKDTPVSGIGLTDSRGVFIYGLDRSGSKNIGIDVSDRSYFKWAKTANEGQVFVGDPIISRVGSSTGSYIITVVSPVVNGGRFNGALVVGFLVRDLDSEYLENLKISENTRIYLIDQGGVVLSGPTPKLIGVNYLEYIAKSNILGKEQLVRVLKESLDSKADGKLDIAFPDERKNGELTRFLVAFEPIFLADRHLTLVVATPVGDALAFLVPFYFKNLGIAGLAFLAFVIIAVRLTRVLGYQEAVKREHELHNIKGKLEE